MAELLVYAVAARSAGRICVNGIVGEPLRAVHIGRFAAIVGRVRTAPKPTDRNLRRYDRAMFELWRRTPALLPVRFGTTARNIADLETMIRDREHTLRRSLRMTRNRAQMTVRMSEGAGNGDGGSAVGIPGSRLPGSQIPDPRPSIPDPRSPTRGRSFLNARAADERRTREVPGFEPLRAAVTRFVRDERVEKRAGVASVYHLVPRGLAARYRSAIERAARASDIRIALSGPWPPYAFAGAW